MEAAKIGPDLRLFQANQKEGYRMVLRQTCVSENFGAISKSEKRFGWVSKSRVRVTFTSRNVKGVLVTVLRVSELSFFSFLSLVFRSQIFQSLWIQPREDKGYREGILHTHPIT